MSQSFKNKLAFFLLLLVKTAPFKAAKSIIFILNRRKICVNLQDKTLRVKAFARTEITGTLVPSALRDNSTDASKFIPTCRDSFLASLIKLEFHEYEQNTR